jgi:large subunit ribosomal protein L24
VERERPIHVSNVMAWDTSANKPSKIQMKQLEDGSRIRVWKHSGEALAD